MRYLIFGGIALLSAGITAIAVIYFGIGNGFATVLGKAGKLNTSIYNYFGLETAPGDY